jgi:hypothetical protein
MEDSELRLGLLVWAKLPGWPWWPAIVQMRITKVEQLDPEEKDPVIVRFFGSKGEL